MTLTKIEILQRELRHQLTEMRDVLTAMCGNVGMEVPPEEPMRHALTLLVCSTCALRALDDSEAPDALAGDLGELDDVIRDLCSAVLGLATGLLADLPDALVAALGLVVRLLAQVEQLVEPVQAEAVAS